MPLKPRLEYSNGQLAIDGKVGREYEVLFSTELKEWQVLETLRLEASPQVYVDKQTADQPIRFYQLRLVEWTEQPTYGGDLHWKTDITDFRIKPSVLIRGICV